MEEKKTIEPAVVMTAPAPVVPPARKRMTQEEMDALELGNIGNFFKPAGK